MLRKIKEKQYTGLTENQKGVYRHLREHSDATLKEVAEDMGISLGGVKKIVSSLKDLELLERIGSKKDGKWIAGQILNS